MRHRPNIPLADDLHDQALSATLAIRINPAVLELVKQCARAEHRTAASWARLQVLRGLQEELEREREFA